jgi:hypothetical protein
MAFGLDNWLMTIGPNATIRRTTTAPAAIRSLRSNVCLLISQ